VKKVKNCLFRFVASNFEEKNDLCVIHCLGWLHHEKVEKCILILGIDELPAVTPTDE